MLIQSIKQNPSKNGSPPKEHKTFASIKNSCQSNVFIHQSFLSKLIKAEESTLPKNRNASYSPIN